MAQVINTNVLSLNAQRNLTTSQSSLATALQRLSSGLRINSAKDDAAGLAISDRFTTQIRGMNQAIRNANDGISLAQTAESALGELTNNLQRIRELAVQSANSTNSVSDRKALNEEVEQRLAEIDRIATQTAFNGLKVLNGTFGSSQFQIGANAGETITINLSAGVRTTQIGAIASQEGAVVTDDPLTNLTVKVGQAEAITVGSSAEFAVDGDASRGADSAYAKAAAVNAAGVSGLTAAAKTVVTAAVGTIGGNANDTYSLSINGTVIFDGKEVDTALAHQAVVDAINLNSATTGVTAALDGANVTLTAADGRNIDVVQSGTGYTAGDGLGATVDDTVRGTITLTAGDTIEMTGQAAIGHGAAIAVSGNMSAIDVLTVAGANDAMQRIDAALTSVSSLRSTFGAIQNRFESTIANLSAVSENLEASRSRILDTDFAAETAALTKAQILQQAGIAILAQANAQPQSVLALLQ